MNQPKILIAVSDPAIQNLILRFLTQQGYQLETVTTNQPTIAHVNSFQPNLVIWDAAFTDASDHDLCQLIKQQDGLILHLVDGKQQVDRSIEFAPVGDDYLIKPFSVGELGVRVEALLKRQRSPIANKTLIAGKHHLINCYGAELDPIRHEVRLRGKIIPLTALEFDLLHVLFQDPQRIWCRAELIKAVWREEHAGKERVIDVHLSQIRKKFDIMIDEFNDFDDFSGGKAVPSRPWSPTPQPRSDGEVTFPDQ